MLLQVPITKIDAFNTITERLGYESTIKILSGIIDIYIANSASHESLSNQIESVIKEVRAGNPKDFYKAFKEKHPNSKITYEAICVYVKRLTNAGVLTKAKRAYYVYIGSIDWSEHNGK